MPERCAKTAAELERHDHCRASGGEHQLRAGGGLKCNVDFMVVLCVVGLFLGLGIVVGGQWRRCAHANSQ